MCNKIHSYENKDSLPFRNNTGIKDETNEAKWKHKFHYREIKNVTFHTKIKIRYRLGIIRESKTKKKQSGNTNSLNFHTV